MGKSVKKRVEKYKKLDQSKNQGKNTVTKDNEKINTNILIESVLGENKINNKNFDYEKTIVFEGIPKKVENKKSDTINGDEHSIVLYNKLKKSREEVKVEKKEKNEIDLSEKKVKKFKIRHVFLVIILLIIFIGVSVPLIAFYGPFDNVRKTLVGASMSTLNHQYIAKMFLSEEKIQEILSSEHPEEKTQQNLEEIETNTKKENFTIEVHDIKGEKFKGKLMEIKEAKAVKVGYSSKLGDVGEFTSTIAKKYSAIAAINAGGFTDDNYSGTGGKPTGLIISNGKVIFSDIEDNDEKRDMVAMTADGKLLVGKRSVNELKDLNVVDAVSFGPALIVDGNPTITDDINGGWGIAPRTAIGQKKDGSIVFLIIDGRQALSIGASLKEIQDIMLDYGVYNASNLDGGSSTTMFYSDKVINMPCDILGERAVPTIFYVK